MQRIARLCQRQLILVCDGMHQYGTLAPFYAAGKFGENQFKARGLHAIIRHVYQHLFVYSKKPLQQICNIPCPMLLLMSIMKQAH